MNLYQTMREQGHEGLHLVTNPDTGLVGAIALHNTRLGPGLGGTRFISYVDESAAFSDVLRLSRAMTYKAALAKIPYGGGKGVILKPRGDFDRTALLLSYGQAVERLGGAYVTTEDSGTSQQDMDIIREATSHVVGISPRLGGTGDPSPSTARGVFRGTLAAAQHVWDRSDLEGLHVAIQGVGHVGTHLARELHAAGATLTVADVDESRARQCADTFGARITDVATIHAIECDIFAPCALGGALNPTTIAQLQCKIVSGAANNQFENETRDALALLQRGIEYCPDYANNSGGLIQVAGEHRGATPEAIADKVEQIHHTLLEILRRAHTEGESSHVIANRLAEERFLK